MKRPFLLEEAETCVSSPYPPPRPSHLAPPGPHPSLGSKTWRESCRGPGGNSEQAHSRTVALAMRALLYLKIVWFSHGIRFVCSAAKHLTARR